MLADELKDTRDDLKRHIAGCEDGQRANADVIAAMSVTLGEVKQTVDSYKTFRRVVSSGAGSVAKWVAGVVGAVAVAVIVLAIQNIYLHRDTAKKVEGTAAALATVTASNAKSVENAQELRDNEIIRLLKQRNGHP